MEILSLLVILLCGTVSNQSPGRECNDTYEFPCNDRRGCFDELQLCDANDDCADGSDENFCGEISKLGALGYSNMNQATIQTEYASDIRQAVEAAADFLLHQRRADYGWGSAVATSRAIVALSFAERVRQLPESDWQLMKRQLNIQLSLDLLPVPACGKRIKSSLSHLALYINALYATCQDPRSFQGLDLVDHLRTETEKSMSSKFSLPVVILTLCVADESDPRGARIHQLRKIYSSSDRISTQALALRAWDCMARRRHLGYFNQYTKYLNEFSLKMVNITDKNLDVYSTALYFQAYNAAVLKSNMSTLLSHRKDDGSFGDLLATYYAIPALLNATLMQRSCDGSVSQESTENTFNMNSGSKSVTYSLWIPTDSYVSARTITVNCGDTASFYDVMRMAEFKDPTYRFMYGTKGGKKKIYSIANTPNDAETGKFWTLYRANGEVVINSAKNLMEFKSDIGDFHSVDDVLPENGAHYVFWLKRRIPMI